MKEKLVIKNFGPIKDVSLDLGKMTILIGDNATGKSTIAKILSICRYFSYLQQDQYIHPFENPFGIGLEHWGIYELIKNDSYILYQNHDYEINVVSKPITSIFSKKKLEEKMDLNKLNHVSYFFPELIPKSKDFIHLLEKLNEQKKANGWNILQSFYEKEVSKVMHNPCFIPVERVLQGISFNKDLLLSEAVQDQLRKLERFAINSGSTPRNLNLLNLEFKREGNRNFIKKGEDKEFYPVAESASGFQNITAIALAINNYNYFDKKPKTFIIEEPEISLFPKSQKKLIEYFVQNINENNHQFILPTHSPYILSVVNDLLMAYKQGQINEQAVLEVFPNKNSWLNPKDCAVYQLKEGKSFPLMDEKLGLIKDNIIDEASEEINDDFNDLLDIR